MILAHVIGGERQVKNGILRFLCFSIENKVVSRPSGCSTTRIRFWMGRSLSSQEVDAILFLSEPRATATHHHFSERTRRLLQLVLSWVAKLAKVKRFTSIYSSPERETNPATILELRMPSSSSEGRWPSTPWPLQTPRSRRPLWGWLQKLTIVLDGSFLWSAGRSRPWLRRKTKPKRYQSRKPAFGTN